MASPSPFFETWAFFVFAGAASAAASASAPEIFFDLAESSLVFAATFSFFPAASPDSSDSWKVFFGSGRGTQIGGVRKNATFFVDSWQTSSRAEERELLPLFSLFLSLFYLLLTPFMPFPFFPSILATFSANLAVFLGVCCCFLWWWRCFEGEEGEKRV